MQQDWRGQTLCFIEVEFTFTKWADLRVLLWNYEHFKLVCFFTKSLNRPLGYYISGRIGRSTLRLSHFLGHLYSLFFWSVNLVSLCFFLLNILTTCYFSRTMLFLFTISFYTYLYTKMIFFRDILRYQSVPGAQWTRVKFDLIRNNPLVTRGRLTLWGDCNN